MELSNMADSERIDKVLWALRVFKTRTEATDACKGGKVKIGGVNAKPSRPVKVGETISVHKGIIQFTYFTTIAVMPGRRPSIGSCGTSFTSKLFTSYCPLILVARHTAYDAIALT